jgi:hypothetical protein
VSRGGHSGSSINMRDGGLGKLHKRMRRFGDTVRCQAAGCFLTSCRLYSGLKSNWKSS